MYKKPRSNLNLIFSCEERNIYHKVQFLHGIHLESRINSLQIVTYFPAQYLFGLSRNLPHWGDCVTAEIKASAGDHLYVTRKLFQGKRAMLFSLFSKIYYLYYCKHKDTVEVYFILT